MPDVSRLLPPDIEIARQAPIRPIEKIAERLGIVGDDLECYGKYKAKVSLDLYHRLQDQPTGKLILVTAITPTPAGEGKTTTSIGLCDGLNRIGKQASVCLREPSLGPCFGMKGGAAGGGKARGGEAKPRARGRGERAGPVGCGFGGRNCRRCGVAAPARSRGGSGAAR